MPRISPEHEAARPGVVRSLRELRRAAGRSWPALTLLVAVGFTPIGVKLWDSAFYVCQLTSIWHDHDLRLHDDLIALDEHPADRLNAIGRTGFATGTLPNTFSIGPAFLNSPIAGPVILATRWLGQPRFGEPLRVALALVTVLTLAVLIVSLEILLARARAGRRATRSTLLSILAGTPLLAYTFSDYTMAHHLSAVAATVFTVCALGWVRAPTPARAALCGLAAGVLVIVRWQDACFALWLLPIWVARMARASREERHRLVVGLPIASLALLVVAGVQMAAWWQQFGRALTMPQSHGYMHWRDPAIREVLFSARNGLLPWSPVVAFAILGMVVGLVKRPGSWRAVHLGGWLVLASQVYVNGCVRDWWGGDAFGARRFCSLAPVFALGIAELMRARSPRWFRWAIPCVAVGAAIGSAASESAPLLDPRRVITDLAAALQVADRAWWTTALVVRVRALVWVAIGVIAVALCQRIAVRLATRSATRNWTSALGLGYATVAVLALATLRPRAIDVAPAWRAYLEGRSTEAAASAAGVPRSAVDLLSSVICVIGHPSGCAEALAGRRGEDGVEWLEAAERIVRDEASFGDPGELRVMARSRWLANRLVAIRTLGAAFGTCKDAVEIRARTSASASEVEWDVARRSVEQITRRAGCELGGAVAPRGPASTW